MRPLLPLVAGLAVLVAVLGVSAQNAAAVPPGAAASLYAYAQTCLPDGSVRVSFSWQPSHRGVQWLDISKQNNFTYGWMNAGPLPASQSALDWNHLEPGTRYYARVNTWANGWAPSDTLSFVTGTCGGFSPPSRLQTTVLGPNSVRWEWDRGNGNAWFCVDTAFTPGDLLTFTGSFHNWGCGTSSTQLIETNLACGAKHYWRVFAWGPGGSGHSPISEFTTANCYFTGPDDIEATVLGPSRVRFEWDRGIDNHFFCVDTAQSEADLKAISGSFRNHGCGTTGESFTATDIACGVQSWWRVWAAGTSTSGYSEIGKFTTPACPFSPPLQPVAETIDHETVLFQWTKGVDNLWSCVDTAKSEADLNSLSGSWRNHGCGTAADELEVSGLECDTTYYWRVFSRGSGGASGSSEIATARTAACL